ncbi:MAG TPA: DUF2071 domain-containing protein, partial [Phnomibacter sp.]|nr:DUF2071 domain-containing protein [Phnomibacter sp.]
MLQNHPFAVQACLEHTIVLSFAVPKEALQPLVPAPLQLDVYHQKWAFIAVALVHTKHLRPKGFPKFMGNSFTLVGYRIFVRYANQAGKSLRGLYILKSETNKRKMEILGNLFTQYKYATTDITVHKEADKITIKSHQSKFHITLQQRGNPVELPPSSPFTDWKTARRFAGPLPFTFS